MAAEIRTNIYVQSTVFVVQSTEFGNREINNTNYRSKLEVVSGDFQPGRCFRLTLFIFSFFTPRTPVVPRIHENCANFSRFTSVFRFRQTRHTTDPLNLPGSSRGYHHHRYHYMAAYEQVKSIKIPRTRLLHDIFSHNIICRLRNTHCVHAVAT